MNKLQDYSVYIKRMEASLQEKLYFLNYLSPDIKYILDFGCADGTLIEALQNTGYTCFGVDNDANMRVLAQRRLGVSLNTYIYSSLSEFLRFNKEKVSQTAVILSSVIHEVFSYNSRSDALSILHDIFNAGFKQICIRDMAFNEDLYGTDTKVFADVSKIKNHNLYESYINHLGHDIKSYADLYHFLLKYNYPENWDRELNENYVIYSMQELLDIYKQSMKIHRYSINYFEHKVLEYTQNKVYEDFKIFMDKATNYKVVYDLC